MTIEYKHENDLKVLKKILSEHDYSLAEEDEYNKSNTQGSSIKLFEQIVI
jgi:hypothetical protein